MNCVFIAYAPLRISIRNKKTTRTELHVQPGLSWWAQVDSNYRPHAYQACALTCWAMSPRYNQQRALLIVKYPFAPRVCVVEMSGIEPLTPCLQGRCSPSWATPPRRTCSQMPRYDIIWQKSCQTFLSAFGSKMFCVFFKLCYYWLGKTQKEIW